MNGETKRSNPAISFSPNVDFAIVFNHGIHGIHGIHGKGVSNGCGFSSVCSVVPFGGSTAEGAEDRGVEPESLLRTRAF